METVHEDIGPDHLAGVAERQDGILEQDIPRFTRIHKDIGHRDSLLQEEPHAAFSHGIRHGLETRLQGGQGLLGGGDVDVVEPVAPATGQHENRQGTEQQFLHHLVIPG